MEKCKKTNGKKQRSGLKRVKKFILAFVCGLMILTLNLTSVVSAANSVPAFPGAEGFGKWATGGRGGRVIEVTNLNDNGPGSLRAAINERGPRIVVFRVSGTIDLQTELSIKNPDITIAGQTAPGDGICLKGKPFVIAADNVIVRYLRVRLGDIHGGESDTMTIENCKNVIVDHCSVSWSIDETLSIAGGADKVTVQWCIISESLNDSTHSKGDHGFGSLIRGGNGSSYTYYSNLYAHHSSRNPRPGNYTSFDKDPDGMLLDFRNNVVYDWGYRAGYNSDANSVSKYNFVNNYYKKGPSTTYDYIFRESCPYAKAYFSGNSLNGNVPSDPWSLVKIDFSDTSAYKQDKPFDSENIPTVTADEAYKKVLEGAGASLVRDSVDQRIIDDVRNGTGKIINSQNEVGGWPELKSAEAPLDTDHDGMPDSWEKAHKLNPKDASDAALDRDNDGYTNIEEYINSITTKSVNNSANLAFYIAGSVGVVVVLLLVILGSVYFIRRKRS